MAQRPLERIGVTSPPAFEPLTKTVAIARTDTTAFEAFVIPKGAVLVGAYVLGQANSNAGTSAVLQVGTNPGTLNEILNGYNVLTGGVGYNPAGSTMTSAGGQVTSDTLVKARYVETGTASSAGGPWLVKVEYYFPQPGNSW